jgi:hypothetical protein
MKKELSWSQLNFLNESLNVNLAMNNIVDGRANFLAALSGIMLTIALTQVFTASGWDRIGFGAISMTCFIVAFLAIGVIRPRIRVFDTNNMYYLGILQHSEEKYGKIVKNIISDGDKIVNEYVDEVYDLSKELKIKFRLLQYAADVLAVGLAVGMALIILPI